MQNILDQVAKGVARAQRMDIRPQTTVQFFALRLATKLNDSQAARHYLELAEHHSEAQLLVAYQRVRAGSSDSMARRFHGELKRIEHRDISEPTRARLAAVRVDRRAVAIAILNGDRLEYTQARQLSSSLDKALDTAATFVARIIEKLEIASAALEVIPNGHEAQRIRLQETIVGALMGQAVTVQRVPKADLLAAYGYPALSSRNELRRIAFAIWPALDVEPGGPWIHDAAILGLHVQTERLFNNIIN